LASPCRNYRNLRRKTFPGRPLPFTIRWSGRSFGSSVVSGVCPCNRASLPLTWAFIPSGPLRSTGVTPLHRYYGPIRLPARHNSWLCLPTERLHSPADMRGLSVPDPVFRYAPSSLTPESRPAALTRFFAGRAGLVRFEGLATPIGVTRLIQVRLTLRLASSPNNLGLRVPIAPTTRPVGYMVNGSLPR
jgi:hypothetical protein